MKTLITGVNGYIGGFLANEFKKNNVDYIGSSRSDFDYGNVVEIRDFFNKYEIDKVIHLAGAVGNCDSSKLFDVNLLGLFNLLTVCAEKKVNHFTFASGNNVYGQYHASLISEDDICFPDSSNKYGISKYFAELIVCDFCKKRDIGYSNIRIADVYGPNQKHGNLLRAIVKNVLDNKPLQLYGEGRRVRDYIYVNDVASGLAFVSSNRLCGTYNLGTGTGTSVKQLLDIVKNVCSYSPDIIKIDVEHEDCSAVVLNPNKLGNLGFYTKYTVVNGITEVLKGINQ